MRLAACVAFVCMSALAAPPPLTISANRTYLQTADGKPFFWLGDTAWLLFAKLDRDEARRYLDDRQRKGFNVIQVMALHTEKVKNVFGSPALIDGDPARPDVRHNYWDHAEWIVQEAAKRDMYVGIVAVWNSVVQGGSVNASNAEAYAKFLGKRFGKYSSVVWLNGGDARGDRNTEVWRILGRTLKRTGRLVTFHPFGRTQSSTWFHDEPWLDFNMFQSGHRRYDQDTDPGAKGEDNWRYVGEDLAKTPRKPTIDGEPSYENLPQGLHNPAEPYWTDRDVRRYAWWSVFAGSFGHTYGSNAVMQMHKPDSGKGAYGVRNYWYDAIGEPGSGQMQHLKKLVLSRPFFERVPDQSLIAGANGTRYDYVIATRGAGYAFVYDYSGRPFEVRMGVISGRSVKASWFDPRTGETTAIGVFANSGTRRFTPPSTQDWALVLDAEPRP